MRHDYRVEGFGFRLRPVCDGDAVFIVSLRSARGKFFQKGSQNEDEQLRWQKEYYGRPNDYYFIVEKKKSDEPVGTVAIYDVDETAKKAVMGRWIIAKHSPAAVESAWLIYRFAFEELGLKSSHTLTVRENASVVSFHSSCGMSQTGIRHGYYHIGGRDVDAIIQEMTADMWKEVSIKLQTLAKRIAQRK